MLIGLLHHLSENPVLVLFLLIGLGMLVGHVKVKSVSLGAAAVLFAGIALAAIGVSKGITVEVPAHLGTLGLAIFIRLSKKIRPGAIVTYSLIEGFSLGVISYTFEAFFPGIVISAVLATLVVIGTTLAAFMMGFVRNSSTLTRVAGIGSVAFFFYYLVTFALSVTGMVDMRSVNSITVFGIPLGVIIGVLAVFIGVLCLVRDFDAVKVGVASNVPVKYAWLCTFAIMTDVIWIYLEILRILSYLMRRN